MRQRTASPLLTTCLLFHTALAFGAGQASPTPGNALKLMSLEALADVEVTTASKEPEPARHVPAAITVIIQDDIRRSGATSIPEALRLAPGVNVGRIDSAHWAVGVRGLGDQFSKSVLVLIDGRSVYTPLFAGVMWPVHDVTLDDVDRIEVIRGPGGTIWGSNSVEGVINIITRRAGETRGTLVTVGTGNVDQVIATARYGGRYGSTFDYRVYGKGFKRGPQLHSDRRDFDRWHQGQFGFRGDWSLPRDSVTLQGDVYNGEDGQSVSLATFSPPAQTIHYEPLDVSGGNVMAQWQRTLGAKGSRVRLQAYYDRTRFLGPQVGESRHTLDIDFLNRVEVIPRHSLTWGFGARVSPSHITQTVATLDVVPRDLTNSIYSVYVQDEIRAVPDRLLLIAGAKFEHNNFTGLETQPSARILWTPSSAYSVWAGATRAVRIPSRLETGFRLTGYLAPSPLTFLRIAGNPDFETEERVAYEAGIRGLVTPAFHVDIAAFHNQLDNLESFGAPTVTSELTPVPPHVVLTFPYANGVKGTSNGVEIVPTWRPVPRVELRAQFSYLSLNLVNKPGNTDTSAVRTYEGSSPKYQVALRSLLELPARWQCDVAIRAVDALPARDVDAYTTFDVRIGQRVSPAFEWSVVGQNLAQPDHLEFGHDPGPAVAVRRSVFAAVTWRR